MKVCCLRTGERYGPQYAERLYRGLLRHISRPFDFYVRTHGNYPGWWSKVEWFPPEGRIVVLDLDVLITANVDFLFDYDGPFCIWRDPWQSGYNSSVMSIASGFGENLRRKFDAEPFRIMQEFRGDQDFISATYDGLDTWNEIAPGKVKSFKADGLSDGPGDAAICVFHGQPKMADFSPEHWVSRAWQ